MSLEHLAVVSTEVSPKRIAGGNELDRGGVFLSLFPMADSTLEFSGAKVSQRPGGESDHGHHEV